MSIGYTELILILLVVLLIFGAKRIPEIARALGKASSEFKKAKNEIIEEGKELTDDTTQTEKHQDNA